MKSMYFLFFNIYLFSMVRRVVRKTNWRDGRQKWKIKMIVSLKIDCYCLQLG